MGISAKRFLLLLVVAVALSASIAAGCGGDDDDDGPAASNGSREEQEALLEVMVLAEAEVPDTLVQVDRSVSTNEEAAAGAPDAAEVQQRYDTWGRQLGMNVSYTADPQSPGPHTFLGILSEATLYGDQQGVARAYDFDVERAREADWAASFPDLTNVEVVEKEAPGFGDEAYWLRITGLTVAEPQTLTAIDQVIFRVGRARAYLRSDAQFLAAAPRDSGEGQILTWAQIIESRMRAALEG
jgi:hypothetical protein